MRLLRFSLPLLLPLILSGQCKPGPDPFTGLFVKCADVVPVASGTVTAASGGTLTDTAIVTGGGAQTIKTPSTTTTLDTSGNISTPGTIATGVGGANAGSIQFTQGTAPGLGTTAITLHAPSSVTSYRVIFPSAAATGFTLKTNSANVVTESIVANPLPVANGGTALASGTSGGVLAFTASGTLASSGALTANLPVIGGGAGVAPTVGTRSGNTTAYVTTTGSQTSGDCVKIDASGNHIANGSACGAAGTGTVGNITPVTVAANTTNDQILQEVTMPAGALNTLAQQTKIFGAGVMTIGVAQTPALTFKVKICEVAACGSGVVRTLVTIVTAATIASTNNGWNINLQAGTTAVGASGTLLTHGDLTVNIGALTSTAAVVYSDTETASSAAVALSGVVYIQFTVATSAGSALNSFTQDIAGVFPNPAASAVTSVNSATGAVTVASLALDNLAAVSINTALLPQVSVDAGSTTKPFRHVYLYGGATFGTHYIKLDGTPTSTRTLTLPDATDTVVAKATTDTFTNKTMDAEGTGNVLTIPFKMYLPGATCQGTTGTINWDTTAALAPTATCSAGSTETTMIRGLADFPDSDGAYNLQVAFMLPSDWTGAVDAKFTWQAAATSGDVVWQAATICIADGEVNDNTYNTASTVTDTAKGTTLQINTASIAGVTTTGCAAGELMHFKVFRSRAEAGDTITGVVSLIGVEITTRRAM